MFKNLCLSDISLLDDFFNNCNVSEDHRDDAWHQIKNYLHTDDSYRAYINIEDDIILSAVFMRDLIEQKCRILDFISTRKGISIYINKVGELVDYAISDGENRGFYRFYTVLTEEMLETVDVLKKKNLIFTWRNRYDTYVDESINPKYLSQFYIHWTYIMNSTLREQRKIIRHHHLKPDHYFCTEQIS